MVSRKQPVSSPIVTSMRQGPLVGSRSAPGKKSAAPSTRAICSGGRRSTTPVVEPSTLCARISAPLFGPWTEELTQNFVPSGRLHSSPVAENGPALIEPEVAALSCVAATQRESGSG